MKKQAFTLVELIVVVTILAILGTIAFISFNNYTEEARDSKRQADTENLISKINLLQVEGINFTELIAPYGTGTQVKENTLKINDQTKIGYQGKINFEVLGENEADFLDPKSEHDYPFAYSIGSINTNGNKKNYKFIQLAYVSEKDGRTKLVGNYYKFNPTVDTPSLFTKEGTTGTNGNSDFITDNDNVQIYDI